MTKFAAGLLLCAALLPGADAGSGARLESNVIYGMYSGLALLMDVHRPEKPNGYGVIFISGSGWHTAQELNAEPLKQGEQSKIYAPVLLKAGYTVFSLSHRAAPRFRYPAAVEDCQRAVRFVRHNATRFGVRADRIGALGGSSGGHLVEMLGALDGKPLADDPDPVNRESAKVQCVVARAGPSDLITMAGSGGAPLVVSFMGAPSPKQLQANGKTVEARLYREASPVFHVSADDPPILLLHGDADSVVPYAQSEEMEKALRAAGVTTKLLRIPGGEHGPKFPGAKNPPDYMAELVAWFDKYLKQ